MTLPPGPHTPAVINFTRFARHPLEVLTKWHARYGDIFTVRYTGFGAGVYIVDPNAIADLFRGDQSDLHAGEANSILEPAVGPHSVLVLDGAEHLRQRKLLLPPFQNENRGDAADVVVYCRIKRGASACDSRTDLAWDKPYGPGDDPRYNSGGPPKIVQVGGQLVVLSHRYPTIGDKPDGASSSTVVSWTSGDGGSSWSPQPTVIGKWNLGQMQVIGPADNPTILNVGVDPLCDAPGPAALCVEAYRSGQYTAGANNLSTVKDENYYENLVVDEHGSPVVAAEDLARNAYVRRWTGGGSPSDPAMWTTGPSLPMDQISLAGGPAGVYVMGKPQSGYGPYSVSRLVQGANGAYTGGSPASISPAQDDVLGKLFEDPSGRLISAWEQRSVGLQMRATAGASGASPAFGSPTTVAPGATNGQIAVGATADGGGFVAYNHTGGVNAEGEIAVAGVGTQTPTGKPGIAGVQGNGITAGGAGTNGSCQQLGFGSFTLDSAAGCLFKGTGSHADEYVTSAEVNLWGLRIVPDVGVKIVIDPRKLQIDTTGGVKVIVTAPAPIGDVVLFHGTIHRDLSKVLPGTTLFEFPSGLFKANILGFNVSADIKVRLEKDGVHIPVDLALPKAFGGFSGHAELVADRATGLHVNSVHIHLGPIPLGALVINSIDIDYAGAGDRRLPLGLEPRHLALAATVLVMVIVAMVLTLAGGHHSSVAVSTPHGTNHGAKNHKPAPLTSRPTSTAATAP
jgi:hypothetical protein